MTTRQDNDNLSLYYAGWIFFANGSLSGGHGVYTNAVGATATFRFEGKDVTWKTLKTPTSGITDVYLDGKKVKTFDGYAKKFQSNVTGYAKSGLPTTPGNTHTLKLVSTGTKNAASQDTCTDVDRVLVGKTSFQENDPSITYGPWSGVRDSRASGGTYRESASTDYPAGFYPFVGPELNFVTATGPTRGSAILMIARTDTRDVVTMETYDLQTTSEQWQVVKSVTGLDPSVQYVAMVASSDGKPVVVDAFDASI